MEVCPISTNQPSCKGYIHKSLKKYINNIVKTECYSSINTAQEEKRRIDFEHVIGVEEQGKRILKKLNTYMKLLHKKTNIDIGKSGFLRISNPIAEKPIIVYRSYYTTEPVWDSNRASVWINSKNLEHVDTAKPNLSQLDILEHDADEIISKIPPNNIENAILELAVKDFEAAKKKNKKSNIFERLKIKLKAKAIDRYSKKGD